MAVMMMSDFVEEQTHHTKLVAKQSEELERQRQQIIMMQQQLAQNSMTEAQNSMIETQNNMTQAQNNMSQTITQSVAAALAAYDISPQAGHQPFASPQPSRNQGSGLRMNTPVTYSTDSTQTSPIVLEHQQQQLSPQDDVYRPIFDPDYSTP
ncbi:hypothetical protein SLA2020_020310 [Shorea laevis]